MGTSWAVDPSFVQAAARRGRPLHRHVRGVREHGKSEKVLGEVLERTRHAQGRLPRHQERRLPTPRATATRSVFEEHLDASLERLKTDYVDCYYIHGIDRRRRSPMLRDPGVKAAFEALKKAGKIRFAGLSCHDAQLPEILEAAAEVRLDRPGDDQVQLPRRGRRRPSRRRAIDKASKANLGLVAMKTQGGAGEFQAIDASPKFNAVRREGLQEGSRPRSRPSARTSGCRSSSAR